MLIRILVIFLCITFSATEAQSSHPNSFKMAQLGSLPFSGAISNINTWLTFKIGAGGAISGGDIACDQGYGACNGTGTTTKVIRTDTYGGYVWSLAGNCQGNNVSAPCWRQLFSSASLPNGDPTNTLTACLDSAVRGCYVYDIRIAPSNTNIAYMLVNGYLYKTTTLQTCANGGSCLWAATGFTRITDYTGAFYGGAIMAVDPANANNLIVCTPTLGCFKSTNGATTFNALTGVSNAASTSMLVAFDPSSTSGGATPNFYVAGFGVNPSKCTGGLTSPSCSAITTGTSVPQGGSDMKIMADGTVYLADNSSTLHIYTGGAWVAKSPGLNAQSVAIDPANQTFASNAHIVVNDGSGTSAFSSNSATSFTGNQTPLRTATDVPWLQSTDESFFTSYFMTFDPAQSNVVYDYEGIGVWFTNPGTGTSKTWISQSAGIEQLVANWIVSPPGGVPVAAVWDRCVFRQPTPDIYPSTAGTINTYSNLPSGWSVDWSSSSPGTIVALCNGFQNSQQTSGVSNDGGITWTQFTVPNLAAGAGNGGCIAASTPLNFLTVGTDNGANANQPYYTINGGVSWVAITISGINTSGGTGWNSALFQNVQNCAADRVTANKFYLYNNGASGGTSAGIYTAIGPALTTWTQKFVGALATGAGFNGAQQMRTVPGQAGELWFTIGHQGAPHPNATPLYHCTDGTPMLCPTISNIEEVYALGFGKALPGGSGYPSVYIAGYANCGQSGINNCPNGASGYTFGIWRSTDTGATWKYLGIPLNSLDTIKTVEGDNNSFGTVYVGYQGSAYAYGQFNFLLKRDLDPASNDNDPMWLEKVA